MNFVQVRKGSGAESSKGMHAFFNFTHAVFQIIKGEELCHWTYRNSSTCPSPFVSFSVQRESRKLTLSAAASKYSKILLGILRTEALFHSAPQSVPFIHTLFLALDLPCTTHTFYACGSRIHVHYKWVFLMFLKGDIGVFILAGKCWWMRKLVQPLPAFYGFLNDWREKNSNGILCVVAKRKRFWIFHFVWERRRPNYFGENWPRAM